MTYSEGIPFIGVRWLDFADKWEWPVGNLIFRSVREDRDRPRRLKIWSNSGAGSEG